LKKIYIVSEYFPPSFASTGQLMEELALELSEYFDVNIVTTIDKKIPAKIYDKLKIKWFRFTKLDKNKKVGRVYNGLKFLFKTFFFLLFSDKKSVFLFVSNPPYIAVVGCLLNFLRGARYVYLIHDQYPEIAEALGYLKPNSALVKIWKGVNNKIFGRAEKIIALGALMKNKIGELYPKYSDKISVVTNWADRKVIFPISQKEDIKKKIGYSQKFIVQYSGNIGLFHNLEALIDAANLLKDYQDILFLFIGDGGKKKSLISKKDEYGLNNVVFENYLEKKYLNLSLNLADIAIISLDDRVNNLCVPSKFCGIIASGTPIVALCSPDTDIGYEVQNKKLGYLAAQNDPNDIAKKILIFYNNRNLIKDYSDNIRKYFINNYDISLISLKYKNIFEDIMKND